MHFHPIQIWAHARQRHPIWRRVPGLKGHQDQQTLEVRGPEPQTIAGLFFKQQRAVRAAVQWHGRVDEKRIASFTRR